jgi:ribonucleoside-triphosphate reductase
MDYKLRDTFIDKYKNIEPNFGFNGLGKLAYLRTYSRLKDDNTNEKWFETIRRVIEGTYSIQKRHILKYDLGWDETEAHKSAEEMYDRMFNMKFLPPGRGLWAMGTNIIEEKGLFPALNNCAFVSTENILDNPTRPFEFMMDMLMLGVGIGFDVKGANKLKVYSPFGELGEYEDYIIDDSREGWVTSLQKLLNSYFKQTASIKFNYTKIRESGEPIKTFGGKAAGKQPLRKLHEQVRNLLDKRINEYLTSTDIVDIMNMISVCVVSGNVRKGAQIVFGEPNDEEFLKLKDYKWNEEIGTYVGTNVHRAQWGWTSNNSVFCKSGTKYRELAKQTATNGEPGYFWLENARLYGRFCDVANNKDHRAVGANPCSEQTLESYEMCCLVETFPTLADSLEDFLRTLKFAYLYAKTVTLGKTHWVETNRVQLRNRRIGTSMSGITQFIDDRGLEELKTWLNKGYETIQHYDEIYSNWLAVPRSIKTTSIKPSGTVSLLPGVTPGIHYPEANFYIRRMRLSKNSELVPHLKESGYIIEDDISHPDTTVVVEIPVAIKGVRTLNEVSMWEQLSLAAFVQKYWADNQVSCTVTFKPKEANQIESALNYFQYQLKGISFLPKAEFGAYPQMPYEEISEDEYKKKLKKITDLTFNGINVNSEPEKGCDSDICQIS